MISESYSFGMDPSKTKVEEEIRKIRHQLDLAWTTYVNDRSLESLGFVYGAASYIFQLAAMMQKEIGEKAKGV